ncbi:MAG: protein tyrosine phosphatase family protein [Halieaceae bacterium]|jgi:protein tyrosine phosphatase (PTP) superfamily phosphohydrolase (DUF442 family)|nr:protein tyrosine phosphatase family protein [Halieaceae bacterium]
MSVREAYNYREVSPQLSTAGVISEEQLGELGSEGFEAVINLLPEDSPYAIAGERGIVTGQGIDYTYIPVDFAAPTAQDFEQFAAAMQAQGSRKLMVHCAANYRVSAFYAIYGVKYLGWSREQALDFIAATWDLSEKPVWDSFVADMLG